MTDPLAAWLDEMEAKCRAATPGPWFAISDYPSFTVAASHKDIIATRNRQYRAPFMGRANFGCAEQDAAYIAALPPETVSALLECVRAARAMLTDVDLVREDKIGFHLVRTVALDEALARLRKLALGDA